MKVYQVALSYAILQQAPSTVYAVSAALKRSVGGSVVEFSPATREARVRFPANASSILFLFLLFFLVLCVISSF